jgi:hypothetical protein
MTDRPGNAALDGDDDPRVSFVYQEAVRGLTHQQGVVESLNTRAGNLIFTTAFATSLLAPILFLLEILVWLLSIAGP